MRDSFRRAHLRRQIIQAHEKGLLDERARDRALGLIHTPVAWWWGIDRLLLSLGIALVLTGIVFFFAFNWRDMMPFVKFTLLEVGLLACLIAGWHKGFDHPSGKFLLLSASVILGVLLAVFGQVYQTGADSYQLFLAWSVLLLPWTALLRFKQLWLLWFLVSNIGLILFFDQAGRDYFAGDDAYVPLILALFNGLFLILGETRSRAGIPRLILWLALLVFAAIPLFTWIFELERDSNGQIAALFFWLLAIGTGYAYFRYLRPDFNATALVVLSLSGLGTTLLIRLLADMNHDIVFLVTGFIVIASASATILVLYRLRKSMEARHER